MKKRKHGKKENRNIQIIFIVILIVSVIYITYYFYNANKENREYSRILDNIVVDKTKITEEKTERMLQLEELKKENSDIIGWLEIEGTDISYPVLQTTDNDFYLTHNYKKEDSVAGSLFLDKDFDLVNGSSNYLIYGHRNKQGLMFEHLIEYKNEQFFKEHPTIRFTTIEEDATYEIISVFYSRLYYKSETNVFRYYFFINAETEEEYNEFVENSKKASIYDTGKTAEYGDQLLTLSTCEYSQEDGRFAVVARKVKK